MATFTGAMAQRLILLRWTRGPLTNVVSWSHTDHRWKLCHEKLQNWCVCVFTSLKNKKSILSLWTTRQMTTGLALLFEVPGQSTQQIRDVPGTNFLPGTEYRVLRRFFTGSGYRVPGI